MKSILWLFVALIGYVRLQGKEMTVTTTDSVRLYVKVKGQGPYLLYVHGGPGSGSYWLEKFSGDFLERHFTMVYLDQRGTGRSTGPADGDYSMERMVEDFEQVRSVLHIDRWLTLGHSFGGILQMGYVERVPDAIEGMIMLNCTLCIEDSFENGWFHRTRELLGKKPVRVPEKRFPFRYGKISDSRRQARGEGTAMEDILCFAGKRCGDEPVVSGNSRFQ